MQRSLEKFLLRTHFSRAVRKRTWKKLSTMLRFDVSEITALKTIQQRYAERKHPLSRLFASVIQARHDALPLHEAFAPWIPEEEVMLLHSGVAANELPRSLLDCIALIEAKEKIQKAILSATLMPCALLFGVIGLVLIMSLLLVPQFARSMNPELWTGNAYALYKVSGWIASPIGLAFLVTLFLLFFISLLALPYWIGKWRVKADLFPPWSIYRLLVGSVWMFTAATLLQGHTPLNVILRTMAHSPSAKPWLKERLVKMLHSYNKSANLGTVLTTLNMNFPDPEIVDDLSVYSAQPNFEDNFYNLARQWRDDGIEQVEQQAKIINVVLFGLVIVTLFSFIIGFGDLMLQTHNRPGVM